MVIPTLRRYGQLARVLDALERQEVPPVSFEVIVASDAQEEDGARVATAIGRRPYVTRQLQASVAGASGARNRGWRAAEADLILFLDDDIQPRPRLLAEHLAWHRRHPEPEVGVLGHVSWSPELRLTPFMRWLDQGLQFGFGGIEGSEASLSQLYTANVSLKRVMLEEVGGFDEHAFPFGYEDMDLGKRLEPLGFRLLYNRAAHADHLHAVTLREWRGTVARIAVAERDFVRRYPDVEPYYFKVLSRPSRTSLPWRLGVPLARVVPPQFPWLGKRVWAAARDSYRRALARSFFAAWDRAEATERASGAREREQPGVGRRRRGATPLQ